MANSRKLTSTEKVQRTVQGFLERHVREGQTVIVAYSGGLDSSVVLDQMVKQQKRGLYRLSAIHFHHGLSENADRWADHCQAVCREYSIPCQVEYLSILQKSSEGLENSARRARYAVLDSLVVDWVVLGHHANDQAETLLLNLARGCGILGMAGMLPVHGRYLRPALTLGRSDLLLYANEQELLWCEDESNQDRRYTRNYVRHEVLPHLSEYFTDIEHKLNTAAGHAATALGLLNDLARIDAGGANFSLPFPSAPFRALNIERAINLLRTILTANDLQSPPAERVGEFIRQLREATPDKHPELRLGNQKIRYCRGLLELVPCR